MLRKLKNITDVIYRETNANCVICYQEQLCNILEFMKDFYPRIEENYKTELDILFPGICKKIEPDFNLIQQVIFSGLLVAYRNFNYYVFDLSIAPSRSVSESISEPEAPFSARDGFVENFKTNIALIRTRVRDYNLKIDNFMVGRRSKTNVSLLSIDDIHNTKIKENIIDVINKIDIDAVSSIDDLTVYFQKNKLFPTYQYVGSPDAAVKRLYNGEFLLVIDRISIVVVLPITLAISSRMPIENMNILGFSILEKIFVLLSLFFSTLFLGIVSSFTTYQNDSLSLRALSILKVTQKGIIFPIFYEILIVLSLFELFYLIGFRQPKSTISSTIVLIGGLIIGENLINTGIAGVFIITFTAVCFLMTFIVSGNVTTITSLSIVRLLYLISSFYFGLLGVLLLSIILAVVMYKQKMFGVHYFYPFIPFDIKGIKKFFMSSSNIKNNKRDKEMRVKDVYKKN